MQKPKCIVHDQLPDRTEKANKFRLLVILGWPSWRERFELWRRMGKGGGGGGFVHSQGGATVACEYWMIRPEGNKWGIAPNSRHRSPAENTTRKWDPGPKCFHWSSRAVVARASTPPPFSLPARAWLMRGKSNNSCLTWSTYCPTEGFMDKGRPTYSRGRAGFLIQFSYKVSQQLAPNVHFAIFARSTNRCEGDQQVSNQ